MTAIDYTLPLDELPDPLPIEPLTAPFDVTIRPPGSKSITCRAYVLAALAKGESRIIRPLRAEDTDGLLDALCALGAQARWDGEDVFITGVNGRFPRGGSINLGDGGTPTRFMIACACLAAEPVRIDGSTRMRERPIAEGVDMLRQLGALIEYVEEDGHLPVRVTPSDEVRGGAITIGTTLSSQFISALLLISPWLERNIDVTYGSPPTSSPYLALTCDVMEWWDPGAIIAEENWDDMDEPYFERHAIESQPLGAATMEVEPDASSAVYWACASLARPGCVVRLPGLPIVSHQPDMTIITDDLQHFGVRVDVADDTEESPILRQTPVVQVEPVRLNLARSPDGALCLAAMASQHRAAVSIKGLHTLRVKETDRVSALANELTKVGCEVEATRDSITIRPIRRDDGDLVCTDPVVIETYNDHRMAMAFAILGLVRPGISISNPACVAKSYPGFWKDLARLSQHCRPAP